MRAFTVLLSLAGAALAQRISIGAPSAGQTLTGGKDTSVSVLKGDTLTGSTEIGVSILIHHCTQSPCEDASEQMGSILYSGSFNPQRGPGFFGEPVQNFTVTIPDGFQPGPAVLSVAHANLVGAGPFLFSEVANVTVNVA
ncbi:uncharacterized protein FOMMEDRAFT_78189 [Fomitiporia mediterranea MF3/22]|uniref:uncharacterized protein n=1 Tax=Fomitiporia mediterranea (strain MF3/22) TaxID=694068 RepID=UPI00044085CB|nr:uncharacterized protein FOMMEDRAFT_78189 [Fomitiporia mediterranea MF3/22]EJD05317.1 hypothetical protein FOMMEDRAFT_78189 [Fomitiporia mediterranea MF3/22]